MASRFWRLDRGAGHTSAALLVPALAVSVRTLVHKWRARNDLSLAIARSGPEQTGKLHALVEAHDLPGVVAALRGQLGALPPRERVQAEEALSQPSEIGRRSYAQSVLALAMA